MGISKILFLVQLFLLLLTLYLIWRQGRQPRLRFALPTGHPPTKGELFERLRLVVQVNNVWGTR